MRENINFTGSNSQKEYEGWEIISLSRFPISAQSFARQSLECKVKWDKGELSGHSTPLHNILHLQCATISNAVNNATTIKGRPP